MNYLIDGHNLIGQLPDISLDDPNDEALLVQKLSGFCAANRKHRCHVVFDKGIPAGHSRMGNGKVKVYFAPTRSDADTIMINRIHKIKNSDQWIVVSSDNRVLSEARRRRIDTQRASAFARALQQSKNQQPTKPGLDEDANVKLSENEVNEWLDLFNGTS